MVHGVDGLSENPCPLEPLAPGTLMLKSHASEFDVEVVNINVGELYVAAEPAKIMTLLGSCVAVCLWDRVLKIGGMNHYLLPTSTDNRHRHDSNCDCIADYRYGCVSIESLIQQIYFAGAKRLNMVAKIFGGGEVMYNDGLKRPLGKSIGVNNVEFARSFLDDAGIPVVANDTGGKEARKLIFNTETGQVLVKKLIIGTLEENVL